MAKIIFCLRSQFNTERPDWSLSQYSAPQTTYFGYNVGILEIQFYSIHTLVGSSSCECFYKTWVCYPEPETRDLVLCREVDGEDCYLLGISCEQGISWGQIALPWLCLSPDTFFGANSYRAASQETVIVYPCEGPRFPWDKDHKPRQVLGNSTL